MEKNKFKLSICLIVLLINLFTLFFPLQEEGFLESDEFGAEILRGFGFKANNRNHFYNIPRLTKDSQINFQSEDITPGSISLKQSDYFIPGWADTRFKFRKNITISSSQISTDLVNFPVLIDLYDQDLQRRAQASGNDIMFADAAGSILDHEIEVYDRIYNSTHTHLITWVKSNISSSQDTVISMYYDYPTAKNQENAAGVWNSNYVGVWHLTETSGGIDNIKDSTSNNNAGTDSGNPTLGTTGQIGTSIDFDGIDDYIKINDKSSLDISDEITIEAWVKSPSASSSAIYYYDGYDSSEAWPFDPQNTVDGNEFTRAHTDWINLTTNETHLFNKNTAPSTELGIVKKVEFRGKIDVYGIGKFYITPEFSAGNGTINLFQNVYTDWTSWIDITSDVNAPSSWTWSDVKNLKIRVMASDPASHDNSLYKMEIRVTYQKTIVSKGKDTYALTISESNSPYYGYINGNEISANVLTPANWHYYVLSYDKSNQILYRDGVLVSSSSLTGSISTNNKDLIIGGGLNGMLDEVRLSNTARTADWINASYLNQYDPNSFYSIGTMEQRTTDYIAPSEASWYSKNWPHRNKIAINHTKVEGDWEYHKEINISAGSSTIPSDYSVSLIFDHASMVSSGKSLVNGDDVRVMYWDGASLNELDRLLDPSSSWNKNVTKIWFKTQTAISASSWDNNYFLYYGNPTADSPPTNGTNVFLFYDDFENGNLDTWDATSTGSAGDSITASADQAYTGTYSAKGEVDNIADAQAIVWKDFTDKSNLFARIHIYLNTSFNTTDHVTVMQFIDTSSGWQNVLSATINDDMTLYMWNAIAGEAYGYLATSTISTGTWHTLEIQAKISDTAGEARLWLDGNLEIEATGINLSTQAIDRYATVFYWAAPKTEPNTVYVDDCDLRLWVDSQPVITLSTENVHSLTNFPVLISEVDSDWKDTSNDGYVGQSDGGDIIFTASDGITKLDHEIEKYIPTTGELIAWVKVPTLSVATDTNIYMYYGNDTVSNQETPSTVWSSDYLHVFHLDETSGNHTDIVSNSETGIIHGSITQDSIGIIDGSDDFQGLTTESWIEINNSQQLTGNSSFTVEAWIYLDLLNDTWIGLVQKGREGNQNWYGLWLDSSNRLSFGWDWQSGKGGNVPGSTLSAGQWYYAVATYDGTNRKLYLDGSLDAGPSAGWYDTDSVNWHIGTDGNGNYFDGKVDEVRISNKTRSAEWIKTSHTNYKTPNTFYSVGGLEYYYWWSDTSFTKRKDIIISSTQFSSLENEVIDFPFLIDLYDTDLKTKVQSDGRDILFFDVEGNKLDYEIELFNQTYNTSHAHLLAWVRIPEIKLKGETKISMYYGNSQLTNQENPEGVWTDDYVAVWHLAENGNGTADEYIDSTINNNDGQGGGSAGVNPPASPPSQISGIIGYGQEFDESTKEHIEIPTSISLESPSNSITIVGWVNAFISGLDGSIVFSNWGYGVDFLNGEILGHLNGTTNDVTEWVWWPTDDYTSLGWHQYALSYDGSFERLYIDGIQVDIAECTGTIAIGDPNPNTLRIGSNPTWGTPGATGYTDGQIDEVRISTLAKSADWIQFEFKNQYDPNSLYTVSSEFLYDVDPPQINNFGVDDPGTGIGTFWADIIDNSGIESVEIVINNTKYGMANNGSHWTYELSVTYQSYYEYIITNATDLLGNYITTNSSMKNHMFTKDSTAPDVLEWIYIAENNTFEANVTDPWGVVDVVIVNVTGHETMSNMTDLWALMVFTGSLYMNDTITMDSGTFDFVITANDTAGNTFTSNNNSGYVGNYAPEISNLTLSRDPVDHHVLPVFSNCTLYLNYNYSDPENDTEQGSEIRWYKNNVLQAAYNDFKEIPASELNRGDEWNASVRPKDGTSFGEVKNTTTITIKNSPPVIQEVLISPSAPLTTFDLSISNTSFDEDSDPIISYEIRWFIDSIYNDSYNGSQVISSAETLKGQNWTCIVRAYDGFNYSSWTQSNTVIIGNSPPTASGLTITPNPGTTDDLVANWVYSDVDGDLQSFNWFIQWYKWNGTDWVVQLGLENSTIVGSGNTTKNDQWYYQLRVYDGENYSSIYTLAPSIQILNTRPEAAGLTLTLTPATNDSLLANWTFSDVDGDSQPDNSWLIRWYKDGSHQVVWDDLKTVPSSATSKGEVWNYTLQVFDGTNYSILYNSPSTTIINTPPTVTELTIPSNPTSSDNLVAGWTFSDIDGDNPDNYLNVTIIHWYQWNGTGWELQVGVENSTTLSSGNLTKGETWYYTLQIYDGEAYSPVYSSANTSVLNSKPILISTPTFNKTQGVTPTDTINITYVYFDADNDPEDLSKRIILWYIKGIYNSVYDNQTIIYSANTTEGEIWQYKIQVFDNFNYSIEYTSILIVIGDAANLPPSVLSHNITTIPLTTDDIIAWYAYNDADGINYTYGTPGTYEIFWYLNGTLQPALNDSLSVSSDLTSKHQVWNFTLRVFDGLNWSIQYNSTTITIRNTPPQVTLIDLTFNPMTSENLTASWTFVDADMDSEDAYILSWYINGVYNSTYANDTSIPAAATRKGETWNFTLQVFDGENYSILYASTISVIQNTPPTATGVTLTANPTTSDALTATWFYADDDDDPQNTSWIIHWYKNGFSVPSLDNLTTVGAGNTSKNEFWYYRLQVFDGEEYSTVFLSPNRQILNTAPVIQGLLSIDPSDPVRGTQLELNYTFYDEDDDFQYGTLVQWYRNGIEQSSYANLQKIPGSAIFKGDRWYAVVNVSDGTDFGVGVISSEILVKNTPPVVTSANVFPASPVYTSNTLVANYASSDVDFDFINNTYSKIVWINGSNPVLTLENKTQVPANYTKKNQFWTFEIQIFDGTNWSTVFSATGVIIKNSKPTIANVVLTGGGTTTEDIVLSYSFLDLDNDSEDLSPSGTQITWIVIPSTPTGFDDDKTLSADKFVAGEFVFALITPHDGEEEGSAVFSTAFPNGYLFVGNTAPEILGTPNILGPNQSLSYSAATTLYANYSASDIDSESTEVYDIELDGNGLVVGAEYRWFKNGELVTELTGPTVSPSYLTKGDKWNVSVRPRDRYGAFGTWVTSSEIEIGNSPPQIVSFSWRTGYPTTQSNLLFRYTYSDYDSDFELVNQIQIQWYLNGIEILSERNKSSLNYLNFERDDIIYTVIRVFDGENYSLPYQSTQTLIRNALPEAYNISFLPTLAYTDESLILSWIFTDSDNDPENSSWIVYWYRNGILISEHTNKSILGSSFTKKNEIWSVTFQVFDGTNYSTLYSAENIRILNSLMVIPEVTINDNSSQCYADTILTIDPSLNILIYDPDQDLLVDYIIYWHKNGVYQVGYDNQTTIPTSQLSKGESWYAIVRVFDGDEWSQNRTSRVMLIINKPPLVTDIQFEFDTNTSQVEPDVREASTYQFYVEDEDINISYIYSDVDNDLQRNRIQWFKKTANSSWFELSRLENQTVIPSSEILPGEFWYFQITAYDGSDQNTPVTSAIIVIESRPIIESYHIVPDTSEEGTYEVTVVATNERDVIYQAEFETILVDNTTYNSVGLNEGTNNWTLFFTIDNYDYLDTVAVIKVKITSKVNNTEFIIYSTLTFNFTIEDKAPPRILTAFFTPNTDLNPTNLTFYADVEEFGSGIAEVILYYAFEPFENGGTGATLSQDEPQWFTVPMVFEGQNTSGLYRYNITVAFDHSQQDMDIIYLISTQDQEGNSNPIAFDIRDFPQRMNDQRIFYQPPGLPSWLLLVAGLLVVVIFMGAVVYVKFIRKPELVGLDKELVMTSLTEVADTEVMEAVDAHTIGIVASFFDQRHGPIPIIVEPEILKDNFTKLVDLSDRSFSGTGFSSDFTSEIPSSYDFVLTQNLRISVMSFGFALERPQARGGQENLTLNLLVHQDLFPLVQAFQKQIQRKVHVLHLHMDKKPEEKDTIREEVLLLRKFVSQIVLSYERLYGTTELIEEED